MKHNFALDVIINFIFRYHEFMNFAIKNILYWFHIGLIHVFSIKETAIWFVLIFTRIVKIINALSPHCCVENERERNNINKFDILHYVWLSLVHNTLEPILFTHTHAQTHTLSLSLSPHTHTHTYIHTYTYTQIHTHSHSHSHAHAHTRIHCIYL